MSRVVRYFDRLFHYSPALVLILILPLVSACGILHAGEHEGTPEVQKGADCPASDCVSAADASSELGFDILEPSYLPKNFSLYTRYLQRMDIPNPPTLSPEGIPESNGKAQSIVLQYRFKSSPNIITLNVLEQGVHNGVDLTSDGRIEFTGPDCGETITSGKQTIYYVHGLATVTSNGDGVFDLCKADDRDVHYAALIAGKVFVEVIGFAESGISKDDVIKLASSLHPVH